MSAKRTPKVEFNVPTAGNSFTALSTFFQNLFYKLMDLPSGRPVPGVILEDSILASAAADLRDALDAEALNKIAKEAAQKRIFDRIEFLGMSHKKYVVGEHEFQFVASNREVSDIDTLRELHPEAFATVASHLYIKVSKLKK